ncbi:hypothetical protein B0G75_12077 [Paraburkholderia sp. BL18I3N2]|nr:hypothetical protein B0G75_12077 [Paraburkholderia sp. BL18I3N2]PRX95343.1 hypothetical protein B0G73_13336 [Paraburkholderia sp. BL25I1N1]
MGVLNSILVAVTPSITTECLWADTAGPSGEDGIHGEPDGTHVDQNIVCIEVG